MFLRLDIFKFMGEKTSFGSVLILSAFLFVLMKLDSIICFVQHY
jgi:hypothetical protein